ncbi:hypothetical protein [Cellulomonas citrea]|uniref:hypothetical protein n=1 Tax=Cellulomonas citrea TaxID=1909423 RepID=UPI001358CAFE|nr:hypothetical protein [Cellulomonas citrea]
MVVVVIGVVLTLLVAGGVILFASVSPDRDVLAGDESVWKAFRRGVHRPASQVEQVPVDVPLVEMLESADDGGEAYLTSDELALTWARARERASEQTTRVGELAGRALPHHGSTQTAHRG